MTPAQAHALNRIYRHDYFRALKNMTHLRDNPIEVRTWESWADDVTAAQVWNDAAARPAYRRYQGVDLGQSNPGVLLDGDVRVYPCADECGAMVCVSGPYATLMGPTDAGWFITEHAPKGYTHHGPRFTQRAVA